MIFDAFRVSCERAWVLLKCLEIKKHSKKLIIVYCQKGVRSEQAVNILIKLGLDKVVSIEGGINAWIKEQLPIANK